MSNGNPEPSRAPDNFKVLVYDMIRQIPRARVASYGQIAQLVGYPNHSRLVGSCLKQLPRELEDDVPWQRVINSQGKISPRESGPLASTRQMNKLREEGVTVEEIGMEKKVDMIQYGWEGPL